ncbi:hypothetical protein DIPPA_23677 [Diplonema papillatum]|nr:hypothetical protein DIPPA_23677 [Diplonema papillatum]
MQRTYNGSTKEADLRLEFGGREPTRIEVLDAFSKGNRAVVKNVAFSYRQTNVQNGNLGSARSQKVEDRRTSRRQQDKGSHMNTANNNPASQSQPACAKREKLD